MKNVLMLALVGLITGLSAFAVKSSSHVKTNLADGDGRQEYWMQFWDGNLDHGCNMMGNNCITIIYIEDRKGDSPGLAQAIAGGTSALSEYLNIGEGIDIPISESDREALSNGSKIFYPMVDPTDGGTFYRFK